MEKAALSYYAEYHIHELENSACAWLGRRFLKITFSQQEDDPIVDVDEIRELLDEDIKEAGNE